MQTIKDLFEIIYFLREPVVEYFAFKAFGHKNETKNQVTVSVHPMKLNQFIKRD